MTTSRVKRVTVGALDGSYGPDADRRIVLTFIPGDGEGIPDLLELRPHGTRRPERIAVKDVYRFALRCRVNLGLLEKARQRKARKAQRLADARMKRAEAKLVERIPE